MIWANQLKAVNLLSNPFRSLQGPSHSVLPQGFRIRTKHSEPRVVLTCQTQGEKHLGRQVDITTNLGLYLLHCCQRVRVSEHDPQVILLLQRSLERRKPSTHHHGVIMDDVQREHVQGRLPPVPGC